MATSPTRIDRVNILLVDDQPAKLLTYETILGELGDTLITANSASEALQHLLKTDIAVVLVDVCMPDLDGYELAAMIRQHPRCRRTSIIFVSAIMLTDLDRLRGYEMRRGGLRAGAGGARDPARQGRRVRRPLPEDPGAGTAERRAGGPGRRADGGAPAHHRRTAGGSAAQGRVPGHARPRAAQPAGADPHRRAAAAAEGAQRGRTAAAPATSSSGRSSTWSA